MTQLNPADKERIAHELGYDSFADIPPIPRRNIEADDTQLDDIGIDAFADRLIDACDRALGGD